MEKSKYKSELIVKSNYLIESSYKLTVTEQRIMYLIISKIQKDDKEFKEYEFTIKEFIEKLSLKGESSYNQLKSAIRLLRTRAFNLKFKDENNIQHDMITGWINNADLIKGTGTIKITLDHKLKPFLLELKKNFTKMKLEGLMQLSSIYSYRIYELLKQYEKLGNREFKIEELRDMLSIEKKYKRYYDFKKYVFEQAKKDINEKTDIKIYYEEFKENNVVTRIKFLIERKEQTPEQEPIPETNPKLIDMEFVNVFESMGSYSIDFIEMLRLFVHKEIKIKDLNDVIDLVKRDLNLIENIYIQNKSKFINLDANEIISIFLQSINNLELKKVEEELINQVKQIIKEPITEKEICKLLKVANNDIKLIANKYKLTKNKKVNNLVGFLIKAIEEDYTATESEVGATVEPKQNKFNNYQQRDYNFEELEKKSQEKLRNKQYKIN